MAKKDQDVFRKIGRRIVETRRSKGVTQEGLAAASGLDRSHVGFIEQGRRHPTVTTLMKVASALDVKLEDLFKGL